MFISFLARSSLKIPGLFCLILGPWNMDNFFIHFCRNLPWTTCKIVYCPYVKISSTFYSVDWNQFLDFAACTQNRSPLTDPYKEQAFYTASRVGASEVWLLKNTHNFLFCESKSGAKWRTVLCPLFKIRANSRPLLDIYKEGVYSHLLLLRTERRVCPVQWWFWVKVGDQVWCFYLSTCK